MTKPVKFEMYKRVKDQELSDKDGNLVLSFLSGGYGYRQFLMLACTASEARALAAKINEWADAKEQSERVTFGDLAVREWFTSLSFDTDFTEYPHDILQKVSPSCCYSVSLGRIVERSEDIPVTRLRATFEEVKP